MKDIRIRNRIIHMRRIFAALVVLTLLAGIGVVATLPSFDNRVTQSASVPLLITMRNISEYHAASGTFQTLVERNTDTLLPDFISGERISLYAVGTVDASVNFGALTEDNIEINDDRTEVTIKLPAPILNNATLDPFETRVVGRDRGLIERIGDAYNDTPDNNRDIMVSAQGRINQAAANSDLRDRGEANTRAMLDGMCRSLGYTTVNVEFAEPEEPKG